MAKMKKTDIPTEPPVTQEVTPKVRLLSVLAGEMTRQQLKEALGLKDDEEYLTFVAAGGGSEASVEMRYEDENIRLTQKMMATFHDVSVPAINQHLKRITADNDLTREAAVKQNLIVQSGIPGILREVMLPSCPATPACPGIFQRPFRC